MKAIYMVEVYLYLTDTLVEFHVFASKEKAIEFAEKKSLEGEYGPEYVGDERDGNSYTVLVNEMTYNEATSEFEASWRPCWEN